MELGDDKLKDLKPNSHKFKSGQQNIEPSKGDGVRFVKPKFGTRLFRAFIAEDIGDLKDYLFYDFLVPIVKDTFFNGLMNTAEMILWGQTGGHRKIGFGGGRGEKIEYKRDYSSISQGNNQKRGRTSVYSAQDIFFEDKIDANGNTMDGYQRAQLVFDTLCEMFEEYNHEVSLGALFEAAGMTSPNTSDYTDRYYGWTDLKDFYITHERGGATLHVPRCVHLSRN